MTAAEKGMTVPEGWYWEEWVGRCLVEGLMDKNTAVNFRFEQLGEVRSIVRSYSPALLRKIDTYLHSNYEADTPQINKLRWMIAENYSSDRINEGLYFLSRFDAIETHWTVSLLDALHCYKQLPESNDYSSEDDSVIARSTSLIRVTLALLYCFNRVDDISFKTIVNDDWTIANEKLVEIVLTRPEDAERISEFIMNRLTVDTNLIQEMLSSEAPALNYGIL